MQFKARSEPIRSEDLYYDLFEGGYIDPAKLLEAPEGYTVYQMDSYIKIKNAMNIIDRYLDEAMEKGVISVY